MIGDGIENQLEDAVDIVFGENGLADLQHRLMQTHQSCLLTQITECSLN